MEAKHTRKLYIAQVWEPNLNNHNCGSFKISNGVEVWFSDGHPIKTKDEALEFANLIIKAPDLLSENQKLKTLNAELIEALLELNKKSIAYIYKQTEFTYAELQSCQNSIDKLIQKAKGIEIKQLDEDFHKVLNDVTKNVGKAKQQNQDLKEEENNMREVKFRGKRRAGGPKNLEVIGNIHDNPELLK